MNTKRFAIVGVVVAVLTAATVVACSDTRSPASPVGPAPTPDLSSIIGPRSADVVANEDPTVWRRIPSRSRWVGQEHNRLLNLALQKYAAVKASDPVAAQAMRHDCNWVLAVIKGNLAATAQHGGFEASQERAFFMASDIAPRTAQCRAIAQPMALFASAATARSVAADVAPFSSATFDDEAAAISIVERMANEIGSAGSPSDMDGAINRAVNAAGSLESAELVYAAASVAAGSSGYWGSVGGDALAMNVMADPRSDWNRFARFVSADAGGAAAALRAMQGLPIPWQLKGAVAALVAVGASLFQFFAI
ncbi:MAG: hypothetical protein NTZ43_11070 [Gemmatimonadetes bacterium]|nr:hypothetical protein [Gemmatimonadota bacterium]